MITKLYAMTQWANRPAVLGIYCWICPYNTIHSIMYSYAYFIGNYAYRLFRICQKGPFDCVQVSHRTCKWIPTCLYKLTHHAWCCIGRLCLYRVPEANTNCQCGLQGPCSIFAMVWSIISYYILHALAATFMWLKGCKNKLAMWLARCTVLDLRHTMETFLVLKDSKIVRGLLLWKCCSIQSVLLMPVDRL